MSPPRDLQGALWHPARSAARKAHNAPIQYHHSSTKSLSNSRLGDREGKIICEALKVNSSIEKIRLVNNNLGDKTGKAIGEALKVNSSIKEIYLGDNKLGDEAGEAIGNALKVNTSIETIV